MHATGTAADREEDEAEENTARNHTQPARNLVEQAMGKVDTIFRGGNGWGNKSAPPSAPRMMGIPGGAVGVMTQQLTTLTARGNTTMAGKTV